MAVLKKVNIIYISICGNKAFKFSLIHNNHLKSLKNKMIHNQEIHFDLRIIFKKISLLVQAIYIKLAFS